MRVPHAHPSCACPMRIPHARAPCASLMRVPHAHPSCACPMRIPHVRTSVARPLPQAQGAGVAIRQERRKIRHVTLPRSKYAFLTLPRYSMIALSNAVEPLRMANILTGQPVYEWAITSLDGQPTPASNGLQLSPTIALEHAGNCDILFVCGGVDVQDAVSAKVLAALKRLAE